MNFAILGLGNRGVGDCNCFFDAGVPLVAVCDKKQENLDYAREKRPPPSSTRVSAACPAITE